MRIEHAALYVTDLARAKEFFTMYFGASANDGYHNENTGFRSYFLTFDGGARLELMTRPEVEAAGKPPYPAGYSHLAISLGSKARVDALTKRLRADGYEVTSGPRTTGDGYYESCVLDAEGNLLELTV